MATQPDAVNFDLCALFISHIEFHEQLAGICAKGRSKMCRIWSGSSHCYCDVLNVYETNVKLSSLFSTQTKVCLL